MAPKFKFHSLTGRINLDLLRTAFRNVKRNRGHAGLDKVSVDDFEANLEANLLSLMRDLKTRNAYQAMPLKRVEIPKDDGSYRRLSIPAVRDRVAQEVIRLLIDPLFEPRFHEDSYGYRKGRSCHMAVQRILDLRSQGHLCVLDADIQGFFDNLGHEVILAELRQVIADGNILDLVEKFLKAGVMIDGSLQATLKGTAQGGVISPLLANIVLNRLDWALHNADFRFVRYADDFVVLTKTPAQLVEAHTLVRQQLETLGLQLHPEKTRLTTFREGFDFLGFAIKRNAVGMRDKAVEKFKDRVRQLTQRKHNLDAKLYQALNWLIRGTAKYFGAPFALVADRFRTLDRWVRMRVRCMKYKRKSREDNFCLRRRTLVLRGLLSLQKLAGYPP